MPRIPKYKTHPQTALNYAKKKHERLSEEDEKVFFKDAEIALKYGLEFGCLSDGLHNFVCDYYLRCAKLTKNLPNVDQKSIFFSFFQYIKSCDNFFKQEEFCSNLHIKNLAFFCNVSNKHLSQEFERKLFDYAIQNNDIELLMDYHTFVKVKLPEDVHNYLLLRKLSDLDSEKTLLNYYFMQIKKTKEYLENIFSKHDKNMTLQEFLDKF